MSGSASQQFEQASVLITYRECRAVGISSEEPILAPLSWPPSISSHDLRAPWQAGCQAQVTMCLWQWCEELSGTIWAPDPFSAEQFFTLSWYIQLSTRVSIYCPQAATNRYGRGTAGDTAICTSAGSSLCHSQWHCPSADVLLDHCMLMAISGNSREAQNDHQVIINTEWPQTQEWCQVLTGDACTCVILNWFSKSWTLFFSSAFSVSNSWIYKASGYSTAIGIVMDFNSIHWT